MPVFFLVRLKKNVSSQRLPDLPGHEAAHGAPLHANLQALFGGRWAC